MVATRDLESKINLNKKEFCFDKFLDFPNSNKAVVSGKFIFILKEK